VSLFPRLGQGRCPFSPEFYRSRTVLAFSQSIKSDPCPRAVEIGGKHAFEPWPFRPQDHANLLINHHNNNKNLFKIWSDKDKACCCDERCESVETLRSVAQSTSYSCESKVAVCDIHGKLEPPRPLRWKSHNFLHVHQQNIRSLSRVSPQPVTEEIFVILRSPNEFIFSLNEDSRHSASNNNWNPRFCDTKRRLSWDQEIFSLQKPT
jgi:hypothetical protein